MSKSKIKLSEEAIRTMEQILSRGNSVELKPRKDDIIVLEVKRKLSFSFPPFLVE